MDERLWAANPESWQAARDLSESLISRGDFLAGRGQSGGAEAALGHYERSLELRERLLGANPESGEVARDMSLIINRLGDFLRERGKPGDAEAALGHYRRSRELYERLLAANPESGEAARDVSVSLDRLGDFLAGRGKSGDAEAALGHYERSLELRERLLAANPEFGRAALDVSVSLDRLGDFLAGRGKPRDAEAALGHYERSLELRERLLAANPESGQVARAVMVSLERMAALKGGQAGGEVEALEWQRRALGIALQLWERNAPSWHHGRTAAISYFLGFQRARAAGQQEQAREWLGGCYSVLEALIAAGCRLDAAMMKLHGKLKPMFSKTGPCVLVRRLASRLWCRLLVVRIAGPRV